MGAATILFDFLNMSDVQGWPSDFVTIKLPGPGTVMENRWTSMEEYLGDGTNRLTKLISRLAAI